MITAKYEFIIQNLTLKYQQINIKQLFMKESTQNIFLLCTEYTNSKQKSM